MKLEVRLFGLVIYPETIQDKVYIERLLGLQKRGDYVLLQRQNDSVSGEIAFMETIEADKEGACEPMSFGVVGNREELLVLFDKTSDMDNAIVSVTLDFLRSLWN